MPIYAECAGLMYLTKSISDFDGKKYDMVGALEGRTVMTNKTLVMYSLASVQKPNILCSEGSKIRGHEFHNSVILDIPSDVRFAYRMIKGEGIMNKQDGWIKNRVLASYMHISFAQDQKIAQTFLNAARVFAKETDS
jgi:cobyrinic acid a,c-diamide synthase